MGLNGLLFDILNVDRLHQRLVFSFAVTAFLDLAQDRALQRMLHGLIDTGSLDGTFTNDVSSLSTRRCVLFVIGTWTHVTDPQVSRLLRLLLWVHSLFLLFVPLSLTRNNLVFLIDSRSLVAFSPTIVSHIAPSIGVFGRTPRRCIDRLFSPVIFQH